MTPTKSNIDNFFEKLFGYRLSQCIYIAAKLKVADLLVKGPMHIDKLAKLTESNESALSRILRCLAAHEIFHETENNIFALTPTAELLISDNPNNVVDFSILCGEEFYQTMGDLLYSVKTGQPAFDMKHQENFWNYLQKTPTTANTFNNFMEKGSFKTIKVILDTYDFTPYKKIIDVGGGKGHLLVAILKQHIMQEGVVFDLPSVITQSKRYIEANDLQDRCATAEGDFFKDLIPQGDLIILKVILHDWDEEKAVEILQACRKSLNKSGRLLIIEKVIQGNKHLKNILLGDIHMLATHGGVERNLEEYNQLLNKTGFKFNQIFSSTTPFSFIEAIPA